MPAVIKTKVNRRTSFSILHTLRLDDLRLICWRIYPRSLRNVTRAIGSSANKSNANVPGSGAFVGARGLITGTPVGPDDSVPPLLRPLLAANTPEQPMPMVSVPASSFREPLRF